MKKTIRVVKTFKIVKRSCSLNRYYRVVMHIEVNCVLKGEMHKKADEHIWLPFLSYRTVFLFITMKMRAFLWAEGWLSRLRRQDRIPIPN